MKECTTRDKVPTTEHYAIVEFDTILADTGWDDNRRELICRYFVFDSKEEWEESIKTRTLFDKNIKFYAFKSIPASISTQISINIS